MSDLDMNWLRTRTPSRVHFDASSRTQTLKQVLDFQACHARARDAIWRPADWPAIEAALAPRRVIRVASRADDRKTYLVRPDLGRRLSDAGAHALQEVHAPFALVLGDGLSSFAVSAQGPGLIAALAGQMPELADVPVILAEQARVAIGDEIGAALGAESVLMLVGERPGLSVSDSLGAYFTWAPKPGLADSRRNCVSNIHGNGGLSAANASARIAWLWHEARRMGTSGVTLKDKSDIGPALGNAAAPPAQRSVE